MMSDFFQHATAATLYALPDRGLHRVEELCVEGMETESRRHGMTLSYRSQNTWRLSLFLMNGACDPRSKGEQGIR